MDEILKCKDCQFAKDGHCEAYNVSLPLYGECYNW